ncbi:ATP-binding protein [Streptomyces sp. NPDC014894]|uniref:ATP-binding protein n=1 Tax=Streptomyces sp. NPDC014894 TaxID=3364931 RepID=UPI0036F9F130
MGSKLLTCSCVTRGAILRKFLSDCWLDSHEEAEPDILKKKFPGRAEQVGRARDWTRGELQGEPFLDDALFIVGELSANAVIHTASGLASGEFCLEFGVSERVFTLSVVDEGGTDGTPRWKGYDGEAENGRGLDIVLGLVGRVVIHRASAGLRVAVDFQRASDSPEPGPERGPETPNPLRSAVRWLGSACASLFRPRPR